jgi:hypothetical protein
MSSEQSDREDRVSAADKAPPEESAAAGQWQAVEQAVTEAWRNFQQAEEASENGDTGQPE